jgi:hypothetical protein
MHRTYRVRFLLRSRPGNVFGQTGFEAPPVNLKKEKTIDVGANTKNGAANWAWISMGFDRRVGKKNLRWYYIDSIRHLGPKE